MAYQVLYRTYRPAKFSEVVGQDFIVKTLLNSIKNNKVAHAYLFAGPRGTGKTTIAKLFAKAINCPNFKEESCDECDSCKAYLSGNHPDIIEMDAASNNGVDEIREIIEQVPYAPLLGKYKVYIIDEVHMLSTSAFNALLKTLEEPPAHVIFILATTDPQKVIPTVLSRCQRFNFSKINPYEIKERSINILKNEGISYDEKAVEEIARMAEGGMRDALSLLEQCLAYNPNELRLDDIQNIFGLTSVKDEVELYKNIHTCEISEVIKTVRNIYQHGADIKRLAIDLLEIAKDALIYSDKASNALLTKVTAAEAQEILSVANTNALLKDVNNLEEVISQEKQNQNFLVYFELCLIKMSSNATNKQTPIQISRSTTEDPTEKKNEVIEEKTEDITQEIDMDLLLKILLDANKDLKINDQIIYNKLDLYQFEADKRKFYQLLVGTELFASNKDAIIVVAEDPKAKSINSLGTNKELFAFINKEFGINKMIFAINENEKNELINKYKEQPKESRNKPVYIEKYEIKETVENCPENTLSMLFGNKVKVEE